MAVMIPPIATAIELQMARPSPMLMPNASPMIGSMSGATIIAPITVATESA